MIVISLQNARAKRDSRCCYVFVRGFFLSKTKEKEELNDMYRAPIRSLIIDVRNTRRTEKDYIDYASRECEKKNTVGVTPPLPGVETEPRTCVSKRDGAQRV